MRKAFMVMVALLLMSAPALGQQKGAKALFSSGEGSTVAAEQRPAAPKPGATTAAASKPKTEKFMGVSYWIDLVKPNGERVRASTKRVFKSGERFKLNVKANKPGYLYVVNLGSTGNSRVLFPNNPSVDNYIQPAQAYSVPANTYMVFDDNPGTEVLMVILSPTPLNLASPNEPVQPVGYNPPPAPQPGQPQPDPNQAPPEPQPVYEQPPVPQTLNQYQTQQLVHYEQAFGAKDIMLEDDFRPAPAQASKAGGGKSSKDIVLEDAPAGSQAASYVVAPETSLGKNRSITVTLKLKHGEW